MQQNTNNSLGESDSLARLNLLFYSLRKRVSWPIMKIFLNLCELSLGNGWDKTINKLTEENKHNSKLSKNFSKLENLYHNYLFIGDKAVKFIDLERDYLDKLIVSLQSYQIRQTIFHQFYPFLLSEENLQLDDCLPKIVEIKETDDNLSIVFCTRRSFTERTEIDLTTLAVESQNKLSYYDKIVGTKRLVKQFFDIVVIWKTKKFIEIRVDIVNKLSLEERDRAFYQIVNQINDLIKEVFKNETIPIEYTNFFPLINNLYKSTEGKVTELSFVTDQGSIKTEKMRKDAVDLREEPYHNAGAKAIHHITPYHIGILWDFEISEKIKTPIELILPAKSYTLNIPAPSLKEILITKCSVQEEYNFILDKIDTYLKYVTQ